MIDNNGVLKDAISYDGFGNFTDTTPVERGHYAWTGREIDIETALQYNRARYYDSTTGRWISQDPFGFDAGDSNLYRYVRNATTMTADPSGLDRILVVGQRVYWVIQSPGAIWGQNDRRNVEIGFTHGGNEWRAGGPDSELGMEMSKSLSLPALISLASYRNDISNLKPSVQNQYIATRIRGLIETSNPGGLVPKGPPNSFSAGWEGASQGTELFWDNFTFRSIPSLNKHANGIRAEGGDAIWWSDYSSGAAAYAVQQILLLKTAQVLGPGSGSPNVGAPLVVGSRIAQAEIQAVQQAMRAGPEGARWGVGVIHSTTGEIHIAHSSQALHHDAILRLFNLGNRSVWRGFSFTEGGVTNMSALNGPTMQMPAPLLDRVIAAMRAAGLVN